MRGHGSQWFYILMKIRILERKKNPWMPFRSCLLNSTANPAQFKKQTNKETYARAFLPLNISAVVSVKCIKQVLIVPGTITRQNDMVL